MANTAISDSVAAFETACENAGFRKFNARLKLASGNVQGYTVFFAGTEDTTPYGYNTSLVTGTIAIELRMAKGSDIENNRDTASGLVEKAIEKILIATVPSSVVDMKRSVTFERADEAEAIVFTGITQIIYLETIGV